MPAVPMRVVSISYLLHRILSPVEELLLQERYQCNSTLSLQQIVQGFPCPFTTDNGESPCNTSVNLKATHFLHRLRNSPAARSQLRSSTGSSRWALRSTSPTDWRRSTKSIGSTRSVGSSGTNMIWHCTPILITGIA